MLSTHIHLIAECCCYGAFVCRRRFQWCSSCAEVDTEIAEDQQAGGRGRKKKGEGRGGGEGVEEEEEDEKDRSRWRREHQREMATRAARLQANP